jgi:triosephosphate isomerase
MDKVKKEQGKRFLVVANWKMNKTIREAEKYIEELKPLIADLKVPIWIAVPYTAIHTCREKFPATIAIGAQNMNDASSGAFTGEVAGVMLKEAGADFVLLGHSERRQYFHETDEFINKKILRALEVPLKPLLCVGEGFEERETKRTKEVLETQLKTCLKGVTKEQMENLLIAYEPIWAIGTGKAATPERVKETHADIRTILEDMFDQTTAFRTPILYGGSVSASTTEELASTEGVDGFLVGTASLDPQSFAKIAALSENVL